VITHISEPDMNYDVYLVRSDGTGLKRLTAGPGNEEHAYWSPDGTRIVYGASEPFSSGIWVMNADGSGKDYLGEGESPSWSPDGKQILYIRSSDSFGDISVMNADGSGRPSVVPLPFSPKKHATWAADGKIVFVRPRLTDSYPNGGDIYAVNPDGSGLERLTKGASMMWPSVSPDGSTIAAYATKTDRLITVPYGGDGPAVTLLARAARYFPNYGLPLAHWAQDGTKLVLGSSNEQESGGAGLYIVNADGSGLTRIPDVTQAIGPDWQPSPAPSASPAE
jgi:Tol biopolymer transport system component